MEIDPIKAALARTLGMTVPQVGEAATRADRALRASGPLQFDKDGALVGQPKLAPTRVHDQPSDTSDAPSTEEAEPTETQAASSWQDVVTSRVEASGEPSSTKRESPKKAVLPPRLGATTLGGADTSSIGATGVNDREASPLANDPFWRVHTDVSSEEASLGGDAPGELQSKSSTDEPRVKGKEYVSFASLARASRDVDANDVDSEGDDKGSDRLPSFDLHRAIDSSLTPDEPAKGESEHIAVDDVHAGHEDGNSTDFSSAVLEDVRISAEGAEKEYSSSVHEIEQSPAFDDEPFPSESQDDAYEFDPAGDPQSSEAASEEDEAESSSTTTVDVETHISDQVFVPSGPFLYGEAREERSLPAYWIDKYPVTNADYEVFVEETGHRAPAYWPQGQLPRALRDHPVVGVDYFDALAYASWVGKDLPFEDEWERAARGRDGRIFPWGNEPELSGANTARAGVRCTVTVDTHKINISPEGCWDMVGNCWELTHSPAPGGGVVVRGGSWYDFALYAKTYFRFASRPDVCNGTIGFRCVRRDQPRDDAPREVHPGHVADEINKRRGKRPLVDWTSFSAERRDLVPDFAHLARIEAESRASEFAERPLRPTPQHDSDSTYVSPLTPQGVRRDRDTVDSSVTAEINEDGDKREAHTSSDAADREEHANNDFVERREDEDVDSQSRGDTSDDFDPSAFAGDAAREHEQVLHSDAEEDEEEGMDASPYQPAPPEPAATSHVTSPEADAGTDASIDEVQSTQDVSDTSGHRVEQDHDERVHVDAHGAASVGRRSPTGAYVPLSDVMAQKSEKTPEARGPYAPGAGGMKLGATSLEAGQASGMYDAIDNAIRKTAHYDVDDTAQAKTTPLWMWGLLALAFLLLGYWLWQTLASHASDTTSGSQHASLVTEDSNEVPAPAKNELPKVPDWDTLATDGQLAKMIDLANREEFELLKDGAWIFVFVDPQSTTGAKTITESHAVHRRLVGWGIQTAIVIPPSVAEREDGETMSDAELSRQLYAHRHFLRDGIHVIRDIETESSPKGALYSAFGTKGKANCASLAVAGRLTQRTWSRDGQPMAERDFHSLMKRALVAVGWDGSPTPSPAPASNETSRWSDPADPSVEDSNMPGGR